jgi:hypothetical protein
VVYLVLSGYFAKFEEGMTKWRNAFFETIFKAVLTLALFTSNYCLSRISSSQLVELRKITEKID